MFPLKLFPLKATISKLIKVSGGKQTNKNSARKSAKATPPKETFIKKNNLLIAEIMATG